MLNVNPTERRISLGLKQLESNPWESLHEKFPVGSTVEGKVRNLTDFGAFIEIEDGIDGLVHVSNLSWTKRVKHPSEVLKKGDKVKAIVLAIEPDNRRLSLGVKQLEPDVWESFFTTHRVNDVLKGKVLRLASFGAFVELADGVEGLCHNSEAVDANSQPLTLEPGQEFEFKIIKMNQEEKKVGLSIRAVGEEATRADVESYKHPQSSPRNLDDRRTAGLEALERLSAIRNAIGKAARHGRPFCCAQGWRIQVFWRCLLFLIQLQGDVRLLMCVKAAERLGRRMTPLALGPHLVVHAGRQVVEAVAAVLLADEGDHGEGAHVLECDHGTGDRLIALIQHAARQGARRGAIVLAAAKHLRTSQWSQQRKNQNHYQKTTHETQLPGRVTPVFILLLRT